MYENWTVDNSVYIIESVIKDCLILYMKDNQLKTINVTELKNNKCDFYLNFDESDGFYTIISLSDPEYCIGVNI
jgi:hypothetical protein